MIIGSYSRLEIGKVYTNKLLTDANLNTHNMPFQVIEEVTREEYEECCITMGGTLMKDDGLGFYYRISVD